MTELPLRSISISDFRRLSGHRTLPLDAPIVLLHGPNGTGKTSILAALEMGLTGQIRSMRRQDPRYTAYLPHIGQDFATIRVDIAEQYAATRGAGPLTVGAAASKGPRRSPQTPQHFSPNAATSTRYHSDNCSSSTSTAKERKSPRSRGS